MSLQVTDLRVYYQTLAGRRAGPRRRHLRRRRRRDHGPGGRVGLRQVHARQQPHPDRRPDAPRRRDASSSTAKSCPSATRSAMDKLPLQRRLARPAVRDERHEPDPQDRPDGRELSSPGASIRRPSRRSSSAAWTWSACREDVLDRYPIELSGGMKQRMVMVLSTLLDPSLLIADEITSALDVSTQKAVAQTLVELPRP